MAAVYIDFHRTAVDGNLVINGRALIAGTAIDSSDLAAGNLHSVVPGCAATGVAAVHFFFHRAVRNRNLVTVLVRVFGRALTARCAVLGIATVYIGVHRAAADDNLMSAYRITVRIVTDKPIPCCTAGNIQCCDSGI